MSHLYLVANAQDGLGTFQEIEVGYLETNLRIESRIFPESKSPGLVQLQGQELLAKLDDYWMIPAGEKRGHSTIRVGQRLREEIPFLDTT